MVGESENGIEKDLNPKDNNEVTELQPSSTDLDILQQSHPCPELPLAPTAVPTLVTESNSEVISDNADKSDPAVNGLDNDANRRPSENDTNETDPDMTISETDSSTLTNQVLEPMDTSTADVSTVDTMTLENTNDEERRFRGEKRKYCEDWSSEPFIQKGSCEGWHGQASKCRDCGVRNQNSGHSNDDICRFTSFRKLMYYKNQKTGTTQTKAVGFCDPITDPNKEDVDLWLPNRDNLPKGLELELCQQLISQLGDQFCQLIRQEKEAVVIDNTFGLDRQLYWKRIVEQVREMCDVCCTTLFNYHWTCDSCGFVVCLACFKARMNGVIRVQSKLSEIQVKINTITGKEKDEYHWLKCRLEAHQPEKLSLTQIIPAKALDEIGGYLHKVRSEWNIKQGCKCPEAEKYLELDKQPNFSTSNGKSKMQASTNPKETDITNIIKFITDKTPQKNELENSCSDSSDDDDEGCSGLLALLNKDKQAVSEFQESFKNTKVEVDPEKNSSVNDIEETIGIERSELKLEPELKHYVRTEDQSYYNDRPQQDAKISSISETQKLYPDLPHVWLCSGMLLRLLDPGCHNNYCLFKDLWKRGQPVLVSNVARKLKEGLWSPESFAEDFGSKRNDLVNCMTGKIVPLQPMRVFWDGFLDVSKRLRDIQGIPMLLKLKDWPPGDDFAKMMPSRFEDLMNALPLQEYTHRTGRLNLAARLPNCFIKPDLGPKMYIAYGDGNHLEKGTTNLHLDISDAVNCMVYVGVPKNCDIENHNKAVLDAIEDSDCDRKTIRRVTVDKELPGALWHIYRPWDANKIRDLLNKICIERGQAIEPHHDPIHDQGAYLDKDLRKRLREEYNVVGFPIVQCEGDAVFIPAGAPHQVRNLHNCIKIAEDFVSPENVSHCFQLTEEFRNLSDTHSNHEDKLQIKNIVYHAVKDALTVLMNTKESKDEA